MCWGCLDVLELSLGVLGLSLGVLRTNLGVLESNLGVLGFTLGALGASLGVLGASLDVLGISLGVLGIGLGMLVLIWTCWRSVWGAVPIWGAHACNQITCPIGYAVLINSVCCTRGATRSLVQLDVLCNVAG